MSGLIGNPRTLKDLNRKIQALPVKVQERIAAKVAPQLTALALESFARGEDPYGTTWQEGADGRPVTLERTGRLKGGLTFVSIGRKVRAKLGAPYAKYQVGKRRVLPPGARPLPVAWSEAIGATATAEIKGALDG